MDEVCYTQGASKDAAQFTLVTTSLSNYKSNAGIDRAYVH